MTSWTRDRRTVRQTDCQRDRETERQRDGETERGDVTYVCNHIKGHSIKDLLLLHQRSLMTSRTYVPFNYIYVPLNYIRTCLANDKPDERQKDSQTDRETERQRDSETVG